MLLEMTLSAAFVMDENLEVGNKDLEVRGFSKDEYLGEVQVR